MDSLPVNYDAEVNSPPTHQKKKGLKPSSQRRIETHRKNKSYEAMSRIHKEAFDDTNISLDNLLLALNDLHLGQAKQVSEIPITTRGIGLLTTECHSRATTQVPRADQACDVNTLYRVSLAQHQLQLNLSQEHHVLPDPTFRQVPSQELSLDPALSQEIRAMDQNFALTADLVNATGVVELHQQQFAPFIPSIEVEETEACVHASGKRTRISIVKIVPDPYTVTFNNLKDTVDALSDVSTPQNIREYFKDNNPIPGALFDQTGLLLNPEVIVPNNYDRTRLRRDLRAAESFFGLLGSKMTSLLGKCNFNGRGSPAQMCGYYKERFVNEEGMAISPANTRVRSARPIETSFMVRGALSLLGETPVDGICRSNRQFAFREPTTQVEYIDIDWSSLVTRCLIKR